MNTHRRGSLIGPILLIGAGLLFLLSNFGVIDANIWRSLLNLWPLLLIAAGLDILIGRRSTAGAILTALILIALLVGGVWILSQQTSSAGLVTHTLMQPLDGATRAEVEISAGAGSLTLGPLAEGGALIEGQVALPASQTLRQDFEVAGGVARYTLRGEGNVRLGVSNQIEPWDLRLNRDLPIALEVNTGVGVATLDLERLRLTALEVDMGVGETILTLPRQGVYQAQVRGGVGELTLTLPPGLAARVEVDSGLGRVQVQGDYTRQGDVWTSPDYATAANRVELKINAGVGSILVR
ncbi:MAG: hypothetical protein HUU23_08850 [Caldilineales bacterium]|nr:hypothetical protein [Caldilineales bacterium]